MLRSSDVKNIRLPMVFRSDQTEFVSYLAGLSGRRVFFDTLAGNNGDRLISMGAAVAIGKAGVNLTDNPSTADLILLNGGGAMNDFWGGGIAKIEFYLREYPRHPLTIGPSSFLLESARLRDVIATRKQAVTLFCREMVSWKHLAYWGFSQEADVRLSPDLAFELLETQFLAELRAASSEEHVLVAMRKDREGNAGVLAKTKGAWLPKKVRRPLSRLRDFLVAKRSRGAVEQVLSEEALPRKMPTIWRDVSVSVGFDEFLEVIAASRVVVTDRLHVAILGRLLDKRVCLFPGSYHKNAGVFEFSLSDEKANVRLVK